MKLGGLFDAAYKKIDDKEVTKKLGDIDKLDDTVKNLRSTLDDVTDSIEKMYKSDFQGDLDKKIKDISNAEKKRDKITKQLETSEKKLNKVSSQSVKLNQQLADIQANQSQEFAKHISDSLFEPLEKQFEQLGKKLGVHINPENHEKIKTHGELVNKFTESLSGGISHITENISGSIGDLAKKALGPWMFLYAGITAGLVEAYEQVLEYNKEIIHLQRQTQFNAKSAGYDTFGNQNFSGSSLKTTTIANNIDIDEFGKQIGSIAGNLNNISGQIDFSSKTTQKDLVLYGIEATKLEKLFGAEIGPTITNLVSTLGMSIGDATKFTSDSINVAQQLGLSGAKFAENLEQASNLAGELSFSEGVEGMKKMALLATKVGSSVDSIVGTMTEMGGLNELFEKQQQAQSLGLHNQAQQLSKIYALQKQGKNAEAAALELDSIVKDLQQNGLIDAKTGAINQQGIATLNAAGKSKEDIANIQKVSLGATKTGLSVQDFLSDSSTLSPESRSKRNKFERENRTIGEQGNMILGDIKQTFIDPLAKIVGPLVKTFLEVSEVIVSSLLIPFKLLFTSLDPLITVIQTLVTGVSDVFHDVFDPFLDGMKSFQTRFEGLTKIISQVSQVVTTALIIPFRIVGKTLGFIGGLIADTFVGVYDAFEPVIKVFEDLFGELDSEGLFSGFLEGLDSVLSVLKPIITTALVLPFKLLASTIKFVLDGFKGFADTFVGVYDAFEPVIKVFEDLFGELDSEGLFSGFLEGLDSVLSVLKPIISTALVLPFKLLASTIKFVLDGFKGFADTFEWVIDLFKGIMDIWPFNKINSGGDFEKGASIYDLQNGGNSKDYNTEQLTPKFNYDLKRDLELSKSAEQAEGEREMQKAFAARPPKIYNNIQVKTTLGGTKVKMASPG